MFAWQGVPCAFVASVMSRSFTVIRGSGKRRADGRCFSMESEEDTGSLLTPEPSWPGSEAQQPRNWISQSSQTKKAPPAGHVMPNTSTGLYTMVGGVQLVDKWLPGIVAHPRPECASCADW